MSRRTLIWMGVVVLLVVFVAGVWLGTASRDEQAASEPAKRATGITASATQANQPPSTMSQPRSPSTSLPVISSTSLEEFDREGWTEATVVDVIDGDTIEVRIGDGSIERLRLIGTNSPEVGECYAAEATAGLSALILGETVHLESDVSDRDQFDRLLRYVWTAVGRHVNAISVENGWAIARRYPPDTARAAELAAAQDRAVEARAGLWAADACGRGVPPDVQVDHVEYDAAGNDNLNLNGEWVEIVNGEEDPVDMTGWMIKDESASHRYPFPEGFTLLPGIVVRVFTGCGEDGDDSLYWCESGSAVWNNDGDTVFLLDPQGTIVYSYSYG